MQAPSSSHQDAQPQEHDTPWEVFHQRFSQFQYEAAAGPRDAFCKLWELCSQWLKPQTRSVEQILALFVTEKFLQILPADTESSTMLSLETRERLFTLIEGLQRDNGEAENTVRTALGLLFSYQNKCPGSCIKMRHSVSVIPQPLTFPRALYKSVFL
ncbi:Zinc finger protein 449 [Lemmus lemmus]